MRRLFLLLLSTISQLRGGMLHEAVSQGVTSDVCEALLAAGFDVNDKDRGETALHLAAKHGHTHLVNALLQAGANSETRNKDGKTALHLATAAKEPVIALSILEHKVNSSATASKSAQARLVELLAAEGASIMQPALDAVRTFDPATAVDEVPRLDGESLSLAKLEAALASDADGVALIKNLFPPPEHVTWEWAEERLCADCLLLTTQWFAYESRASVGKQQDASWSRLAAVRDSCDRATPSSSAGARGKRMEPWPNRRYEYPVSLHGLSLRDYLSELGALTGLKHFGAADGPLGAGPRHALIDDLAEAMIVDKEARAKWFRGAGRRILSIGAKGAGIQFHQHAPTWLALAKGRKAWWVGPASAAIELAALGNNASAPATCSYLAARPHPALRLIIQEPGDVIMLGEFVAHATCNLEESMGFGAQMGYYETRWIDLRQPPSSKWLAASVCKGQ